MKEWLASRTPAPPPRLSERLNAAVQGIAANGPNQLPRSLLEAASAILRGTIEQSNTERNGAAALDLLAADAFITYAVEAAAEDCEQFAGRTDEMIARLSAIVGEERGEPT